MSEILEVEAEVIEPTEKPTSKLDIIKAEPGSDIVTNITNVKAWVGLQLKTYAVPSIASEEDYQQAKRDRTSLRKMGENIDTERKRVKELYMAPVVAFEGKVKEITDPIKSLDEKMKAAINAYEQDEKDQKKARLQTYYEDYAPDIAVPLEGQNKALVPFERIFQESWLNRTVKEVEAQEAIESIVLELSESEKSLDTLNLKHASEAKATFWATLDMNAAIKRDRDMTEAEERQAALEAERAVRTETKLEATMDQAKAALEGKWVEEKTEPAPEAPTPTPAEPIKADFKEVVEKFAIYLTCTQAAAVDIAQTVKSMGIEVSLKKLVDHG